MWVLSRRLLNDDVADAYLRVILPVALRAFVLLLPLEFEDENLVAAVVRRNGGVHLCVAYASAGQQIAAFFEESDHFAKGNLSAYFSGQLRNADHIAWSDAKLLPAGFDNCM